MKQVVNICAYTGCMVLLFYLLLSYNGLWNFALYPEDGYYAQTIQYFLDACLTLSPASTIAASLGAISIFEIHCTVPDDKQMASKELILWSLLTILLNSYTAYLISNGAAKGLDLEIWMILIETTAINIVWYYLLLWILKKRKNANRLLKNNNERWYDTIYKERIMKQEKFEKITPDKVTSLEPGQVFVFGSNLIGCHSGGASLVAMNQFGALWGQSEGPQGQCYAIPVDIRGEAVENVSAYMKRHINKFLAYAALHQDQFFLVPKIGCGAAGFDEEFMAPFFRDAVKMKNVSLPKSFVEIIKDGKIDADEIQKVYNLIILDESGSMTTIEKEAVSGLNETLQTIVSAQIEHKGQMHFISLVTFNCMRINKVYNMLPVDTKGLKWDDYHPISGTPLFDAMGYSIEGLREHVTDRDVVLVTIITDGLENASKVYDGLQIKNLVAELRSKGWVFTYIGTNQDVDAVADDMGICSRMSFEYSPGATRDMFCAEKRHRGRFYEKLSKYGRAIVEEDYDYFEAKDDDEHHEPEKKPDIVWDLKKEDSQQNNSETEVTAEESEKPRSLWNRFKKLL